MNASRLLEHFDRISEAPDAIPALRKFILDVAVRGMLVAQDPSNEPAAELIRQIAEEKARLLRAGEIGKQRILPALAAHEILFRAPAQWEWVRIRQVTTDRGQTVPKQDFTYIDVTSINKEAGRIDEAQVLSASEAPSRARKVVRKDDVIYSCVRPNLLNVAIIDRDIQPLPIASTAFAVLNGLGLVLPRYLWIALRSPFMVAQVAGKMRGQAYPAINDGDFGLLTLPLPPRAEQHRIVAKVDELMTVCDQLEAATVERERLRRTAGVASLNAMAMIAAHGTAVTTPIYLNHLGKFARRPDQIAAVRGAIIDLALRGRLVRQNEAEEPADIFLRSVAVDIANYRESADMRPLSQEPIANDDVPYELPKGWVWARLSSLFRSITDGDHLPPPRAEQGVAFLTIGNISSGRIDFDGCRLVPHTYFDTLAIHRRPSQGDVLYTVVGATYGRATLVDTVRDFCVQRHIAILKPVASSNLRFLFLLLKSSLVYGQATNRITGAAQPTIPIRSLRNFVVPVPPLAEQERIVAQVDGLMAVCSELELALAEKNTQSARLLDALIHEVLTNITDEGEHQDGNLLQFPNIFGATEALPDTHLGSAHLAPVPILGNIAAGVMTLADQRVDGWFRVPRAMLQPTDGAWCVLRVKGDSMNLALIEGARIEDGDFLLVRRQDLPEIGKVVVAEFEGDAVLKRYVKDAIGPVLRAESTGHYPDIRVASGFRIQGVVRANLKSGTDFERIDADEA